MSGRKKWMLILCLGFFLFQNQTGITKNNVERRKFAKNPSATCLKRINIPPEGKLPEDVYTTCDRYWVLTQVPENCERVLWLDLDYEGILGTSQDEMIVLTRLDSSKGWSKLTPTPSRSGGKKSKVKLRIQSPKVGHEFTLAQSTAHLRPNRPKNLMASIQYGPIEITWQTEVEAQARMFSIERKIENQEWDKIGKVTATGLTAFPQDYRYEDISIFPEGTRLCYRIIQFNENHSPLESLPVEIAYLPQVQCSRFAEATHDSTNRAFQLQFRSMIYGHLRIDFFNAEMVHETCLLKSEILPGNYAFTIHSGKIRPDATGFCRLEIISPDQRQSFIQIRQISKENL